MADDPAKPVKSNDSEYTEAQRPLFEMLKVEEAWKELGEAQGCRVGILDGGFDFFHPGLEGAIEPTFSASGVYHMGSKSLISHGTAMARLLAAQKVEDDGMVGLAPRSKLFAASMGFSRHLPLALRTAYLRKHPNADPAELQKEMQRHSEELKAFPRQWVDSKTRTAAEGLIALVDAGAKVINFSAHFDERVPRV